MNRNFYFFGIFFLVLLTVAGLFQSIIHFQLDAQIYMLQSFAGWVLVVHIISLAGSYFILKYYYYKKYWFAFSSGTVAIIAALFHFIIFYKTIVAGELKNYFIPTFFLASGTAIVYSISLIFSNSRKRFWLKTAGIVMFAIFLVLISVFLRNLISPNLHFKAILIKINQWVSLAGYLLPIPFIMNFLSEVRILKTEGVNTRNQKAIEIIFGLVGITAFIFTLAVFIIFANESYRVMDWNNKAAERAMKLAQPFEARSYVSSHGDTMLYRLMKPLVYDPKKKYPLVVCLPWTHGIDNIRQIDGSEPAQLLSKYENRVKYPAFIFVPQCPPGSSWGGIPNYPAVDSLVFETLHALENGFEIDVKRCYVTGISLGGYGTWHLICTRPKVFAAAIPICGGGDTLLAKCIVNLPIWAFHGRLDRSVPVKGSRDMILAIKNAGGNPRYTEFPDAGHNIWNQVSNTSGLLDWLFAQKRD